MKTNILLNRGRFVGFEDLFPKYIFKIGKEILFTINKRFIYFIFEICNTKISISFLNAFFLFKTALICHMYITQSGLPTMAISKHVGDLIFEMVTGDFYGDLLQWLAFLFN